MKSADDSGAMPTVMVLPSDVLGEAEDLLKSLIFLLGYLRMSPQIRLAWRVN